MNYTVAGLFANQNICNNKIQYQGINKEKIEVTLEKYSLEIDKYDNNLDGTDDEAIYSYNDENGLVKYTEIDIDLDGNIDTSIIYNHLSDSSVEIHYDNNYDKQIDMVETLECDENRYITNSKKEYYHNINKELDKAFYQGNQGDCWLLSSFKSLSQTEDGKEFIKDSISNKDDGSYEISFKGLDEKYIVTKEDLNKAKESKNYSYGDDDMLLLELAFEKKRIAKGEEGKEEVLQGGNFFEVIDDYTNFYPFFETSEKGFREAIDDFQKNPYDTAATIGFKTKEEELTAKDINGYEILLTEKGGHSWSLSSATDDTITMTNPWNNEVKYTFNKEEIINKIDNLVYVDTDFKKESISTNFQLLLKELNLN